MSACCCHGLDEPCTYNEQDPHIHKCLPRALDLGGHCPDGGCEGECWKQADRRMAATLYNHREGALTCYDHPPTSERRLWCCVCGEHELTVSHADHLADALAEVAEQMASAARAEGANLVLNALAHRLDFWDGRPWEDEVSSNDLLNFCERAAASKPNAG